VSLSKKTRCLPALTSSVPSDDSSASEESKDDEPEESSEVAADDTSTKTLWKRTKNYFAGPDDGLTFRQRLAKMGLATVLSYGWVSNMSYSICISLAWYGFSLQTKKSPLAPGQWKPFLGVYAGFWVFNNVIRPFRLALSVAIGPKFEQVVDWIQDRTNLSRALSVTTTVFLANVVGTFVAMGVGISLASIGSGVPIFPPRS